MFFCCQFLTICILFLKLSYSRFKDKHGNIKTREVPRPAVVSSYFESSNVIDTHNHVRQGELKYEKHWLVKDPWFRLCTTIVFGKTVTDAWMLTRYCVGSNNKCKTMSSIIFSAKVAKDLLNIPFSDEIEMAVDIPLHIHERSVSATCLISPLTINSDIAFSFAGMANSLQKVAATKIPNLPTGCTIAPVPSGAPHVPEEFRCLHPIGTRPIKNKRPLRLDCCDVDCNRRTQFYCTHCNKSFCSDSVKQTGGRYCYYNHICNAYFNSKHNNAYIRNNFCLVLNEWQLKRKLYMQKTK